MRIIFVGVVCGHPLDTIKVIQQAGVRSSMLQVMKHLMVTEGVRGYFKGLLYPVLTAGSINSIFFSVYGWSMSHLSHLGSDRPHLVNVYLAGVAGGSIQLAIACPVELVKIRLQTQSGQGRYQGPAHCLRQTWSSQGVR